MTIKNIRIYSALSFFLVSIWLIWRVETVDLLSHYPNVWKLIGITSLYLISHVFRMLRLSLLTLDERDKIFSLISAHALTAFPSSFFPFKLGEFLRLAAFAKVFDYRDKAFAIWLAERLGDLVVITAFIFCLYLFNVNVPDSMRSVFILFAVISVFGLVGLFAVANVFVYINRHLVLTSFSERGLLVLRVSHAIRRLEAEIYKSIEGRLIGFILLSVSIWVMEVVAISLFMNYSSVDKSDFVTLFISGLLASLPSGAAGEANIFGVYQSLALGLLFLVFIIIAWMTLRLKK